MGLGLLGLAPALGLWPNECSPAFPKADLVQVAIYELPSLAVGVRRLQFLCKSIVGFLVNNKGSLGGYE